MRTLSRYATLVGSVLIAAPCAAQAQIPDSVLASLKPRAVGPAVMGGRTVDFAVYEADPSIFYAASASGGLLKTVNGGTSWTNVFDRQSSVSIGDVAINPNDPNEVWVGTGEANNRQSSSWGDGVYRSTDGGTTWKHMGLRESHHVGRIVINPYDTDIVYVAALGHLWGANRERGVFMTTDAGATWQHVLAVNENTGAVDIAIDPSNPKVLYAATYQRRRSAWGFNGGGPGGGLHKSVDGGRTWRLLTNGLPAGDKGRIGVEVYRKDPNIVYAIVEHREGGIFRSDNKGESWTKLNSLNPRPMYYSQIRIDPSESQRIYVLGTQLHISDDGGKTFRDNGAIGVHLDHHAFWIDPKNPRHVMVGNDGGIWVSRDRSATWEHINNYPTGQFYHVAVDMQQPYWIYGGMQDNASWTGPSAVRDRVGILNHRWTQMLACDGMYTVPDPTDSNSIYTNCQNGRVVRYDLKTGERKAVMPEGASREPALRWNWTAPIVISPHDPRRLYTGGNIVFTSTDRGHSWTAISADLTTRTNRDQLPLMDVLGKDVTLSRNDGVSSFGNISALAESPKQAGVLYVGTDDGNVQVSRDNGRTWTNVTSRISGVGKMLQVSRLTPSAAEAGTVYLTFDGHRSDDFKPYAYVSTDFGQTWKSISANLPPGSVYTLKEDPVNPSVLYLGTEFGLFVTIDKGGSWTRWPSVPTVAVYDLAVHPRDKDIVLGTHGRSFLVIDDVTPLQQLSASVLASHSHLFKPRPATQFIPNESGWFVGGRDFAGPNPEFGAYINYYLKAAVPESVKVQIMDPDGAVLRQLTGPRQAGIHRITWDLRAAPVGRIPLGMYMNPELTNAGPFVLPGEYTLALTAGSQRHTTTVQVLGDPLVTISDADRRAHYNAVTTATAMQVTADSAAAALNVLNQHLEQITKTLNASSGTPQVAKAAIDSTTKTVAGLRTRVVGSGQGGGGGGGGGGTILGRVRGLKGELIGSQSLPTQMQSARLESTLADLNAAVAELNTVVATLPALYRQLADNNIVPVALAPVRAVRR